MFQPFIKSQASYNLKWNGEAKRGRADGEKEEIEKSQTVLLFCFFAFSLSISPFNFCSTYVVVLYVCVFVQWMSVCLFFVCFFYFHFIIRSFTLTFGLADARMKQKKRERSWNSLNFNFKCRTTYRICVTFFSSFVSFFFGKKKGRLENFVK